jgi:hypothetical protein
MSSIIRLKLDIKSQLDGSGDTSVMAGSHLGRALGGDLESQEAAFTPLTAWPALAVNAAERGDTLTPIGREVILGR